MSDRLRLQLMKILMKFFAKVGKNRYFLNMQNDIDVRELKQELTIELAAIPVLMQA